MHELQIPTESLRSRLQEMTERLLSLEKIVAMEAQRKKVTAEQEIQAIALEVSKVERALTNEIRERVDSGKETKTIGDDLIKVASESLESKLEEHIGKQAETIDIILNRCEGFKREVEQLSDVMHSKDQQVAEEIQRASLVDDKKNSNDGQFNRLQYGGKVIRTEELRLEKMLINIREESNSLQHELAMSLLEDIDSGHRKIIQGIRDVKKYLNTELGEGLPEFQAALLELRKQCENYKKEYEESTATYKLYIPHEMKTFQEAIKTEADVREETDDDVVSALNNYNAALQKGFSTILDEF